MSVLQNRDMRSDLIKGLVGISSLALGSAVSTQAVETWLRITSLVVGIALGVISTLSILRKWKAK